MPAAIAARILAALAVAAACYVAFIFNNDTFDIGLVLAIGLFGVMGALVRDRMREFGIRMALGAPPGHVRMTVLRQAGLVAGIGAVVGLAVALGTSRLVASLLFGVTPTDPLSLGGACLVLLAAAGAAAYFPARRATSIDPVRTLRAD